MPNEPQSYGSQGDWVAGNTGGKVNREKSEPPAEHADFYENRRDSESSASHQGGDVSDLQASESDEAGGGARELPDRSSKNVTDEAEGAKRGGYFKDRDYGR